MKSTIEQLWHGNTCICENCGVGVPEIEKLCGVLEGDKEVLERELTDSQKELLKKYCDDEDDYCWLLMTQSFKEGFRLATRLMVETLAEEM